MLLVFMSRMILSWLILMVLCDVVKGTNLPAAEMQALQDIYTSTNGPYWECLYGGQPWDFTATANPCEDDWVGVICELDSAQDTYYVQSLLLTQCMLDGTLPSSIGNLHNMTECYFDNNFLRGTIPDVFGELQSLMELDWSNNAFSGTLPVSLSLLHNLTSLYLNTNKLMGLVERALDPTMLTQLQDLDIGSNGFTGQIPDTLFLFPNMRYLDLGVNCFAGTIPEAICDIGAALYQLELGCLSCGDQCINHPFTKSSFITHHSVHGTLPACVFALPQLYTIVLSQNYLTGTLPEGLTLSTTQLTTLDLSYNHFSGSIPSALLQPDRNDGGGSPSSINIDLSYNRFTGHVSRSLTVPIGSIITLTYDRLSGPAFGENWPSSVAVDVLTGNILSCDRNGNDLPSGDDAAQRYQCGSDAINVPLIIWWCLVGACVLLVSTAWYCRARVDAYIGVSFARDKLGQWKEVVESTGEDRRTPQLAHIYRITRMVCTSAVVVATVAIVVLMPIYAGLSTKYGTYQDQYAWVLASVLLSGRVPFGVCFVLFLLALATAFGLLLRQHTRITNLEAATKSMADAKDDESHSATSLGRVLCASVTYLCINFFVVGVVNTAFVATSVYATPVYQLAISVFKVGWNILVSPFVSRWLAYELSAARADWFTLELFVSIMNNIGIPMLAVLYVSPQCLYDLIGGGVQSLVGDPDAFPNYDQPFYYSYQCSYVYMDYYSAAFVYACLFTSFVTPLVEICLQQLHRCAKGGSCWFRVLDTVLPRSLKPVETDPSRIPDRNILRPLLDSTQFLVAQLTSLTLIVTMGVVFPPLAVCVAATMVISACFVMLKVGRLVRSACHAQQQKYLDIVEQECTNVATVTTMQRAFWMLLWFACWFYTLFLFDTLGDAVGFAGAYWVLIVMPLMPVVVMLVAFLAAQVNRSGARHPSSQESLGAESVETEVVETPFRRSQGGDARV